MSNQEQRGVATINDLPYTYTGLLDDVMLRYSQRYAGEEFFKRMIVKNLLFGGGILFNDGYLVNHPASRRLIRQEKSLLRVMLGQSFIRILTRTNDAEALARMPQSMADAGNEEFSRLVASPDWPELRILLHQIGADAFRKGNTVRWPNKDMSYGYVKLIKRVLKKKKRPSEIGLKRFSYNDLARIEDIFLSQEPTSGNPRHKYEKACMSVALRKDGKQTAVRRMAEIMEIGNQAYHYNFGLGLTGTMSQGVTVDTTWGYAFDEFLEEPQIHMGQLDHVPILQVPRGLPLEEGVTFLPFLDPASKVGEAKVDYLVYVSKLLRSSEKNIRDLQKDVIEATNRYKDRIRSNFEGSLGKSHVDRMLGPDIMVAVGKLHDGRPESASAVAAPTGAIAIDVLENGNPSAHSFMIGRYKLVDNTASMNPTSEQLLRLRDIRPHIASLAFNKGAANEFNKSIPVFKLK